jgi:hypothetical protein
MTEQLTELLMGAGFIAFMIVSSIIAKKLLPKKQDLLADPPINSFVSKEDFEKLQETVSNLSQNVIFKEVGQKREQTSFKNLEARLKDLEGRTTDAQVLVRIAEELGLKNLEKSEALPKTKKDGAEKTRESSND